METIKIYNGTIYRIYISVLNATGMKPFESGWIDPLSLFKPKVRTDINCMPGIYRIHSEIVDVEKNIVIETSVNITFPSAPIEITDSEGRFWWKIYKDREAS